MLGEVFRLFFPKLCVACNCNLLKNESFVCTHCLLHLPQTHFHKSPDNALQKVFWGRLNIESALAFVYFKKGGAMQHVLHEIKYKNNTELALFLGNYYGSILKFGSSNFNAVAAIPLHKNKQRARGYNQSALIAEGIASQLGVEHISHELVRFIATETQTRKSRFERWENVETVFGLKNVTAFENKHVLLIDDVITTGATIEACGNAILKAPGVKLSIGAIAFTSN